MMRNVQMLASALALLAIGCGSSGSGSKPNTGGTTCQIESDCEPGQTCNNGVCTAAFASGDIQGGGDGGVGGDATADGATTADTQADGQATDSTVGPGDTGGGVPGPGVCGACEKDADCGAGEACVPLLNSPPNFCVKKCSADADCGPGLVCEQATTAAQTFCIPPTFKCEGCAATGCPAGESCDYTAAKPSCGKLGGACATCQIPKDCGEGLTCVKQGGSKVCAPTCGGATTCASGSACVAFTAGIQACTYLAATCSYSDGPSDACKGCVGKCVAGACVECVNDSQCGGGTCVPGTFSCTKETCPAEKPHKLVTGVCVECINNTHCAASSVGPNCIANACAPANQTNECSVCKAPYPGCVDINGSWSCVECATDDDCAKSGKGTCSSKTYTCSATTSGGGPTSGSCKSDADCPVGTTGFDLACDTATGLCFDKKGQCDNIAAFCNAAAGSVCKPFDGLGLGGGGLPQIPGLPGGGGGPSTSGAGVCSCGASSGGTSGWDDSLCKQFNLSNCKCDVDATSKDCDPIGLGSCCQQTGGGGSGNPLSLIQCFLAAQGGGKPDPACFAGSTCLDMSCLTAALGGGGGSSSGGGGYCSAGGGLPTP